MVAGYVFMNTNDRESYEIWKEIERDICKYFPARRCTPIKKRSGVLLHFVSQSNPNSRLVCGHCFCFSHLLFGGADPHSVERTPDEEQGHRKENGCQEMGQSAAFRS